MSRIIKLRRTGRLPRAKVVKCKACSGSGLVERPFTLSASMPIHLAFYDTCKKCRGAGTVGYRFRSLKRRMT